MAEQAELEGMPEKRQMAALGSIVLQMENIIA